jgi:antitoxin component of MazEF toxin-antitoxin module
MIKHLTPHGNSSALVIDKAILDILKITQKTPLEVTTDGQNLIISPVADAGRAKKLRSALDAVNKHHAKTLRALAG